MSKDEIYRRNTCHTATGRTSFKKKMKPRKQYFFSFALFSNMDYLKLIYLNTPAVRIELEAQSFSNCLKRSIKEKTHKYNMLIQIKLNLKLMILT